MAITSLRPLLFAAGLLCLLTQPASIHSCGPFIPEASFTFSRRPVQPATAFSSGSLGVLQSDWKAEYLIAAYRALHGLPMANPLPPESQQQNGAVSAAPEVWLQARKMVPGAPSLAAIDTTRVIRGDNYVWYDNCLPDAFQTAARTLQDRAQQWGAASFQVRVWLEAQDQVFQNCSDNRTIPVALPSSADPLLKADRTYQIAAAAFYATDWVLARSTLQAVQQDSRSPWRASVPYLLARINLREGTITKKPELLEAAGQQLRQISMDAEQTAWQGPASRLLGFVEAQTQPVPRMQRVQTELLAPGNADPAQTAREYGVLWGMHRYRTVREQVATAKLDDLGQWLRTVESGTNPSSADTAVQRWQQGGGTAWLIASLLSANAQTTAVQELVSKVQQLETTDPGYSSAAFYGARLAVQQGDSTAARAIADRALQTQLPQDARNLLLGVRFRTARSWQEFLQSALRRPVGYEIADDQILTKTDVYGRRALAHARQGTTWDVDAATVLNQHLPLSRWEATLQSRVWPATLRSHLAEAGWVRAVLLQQDAAARRFARQMAALGHPLSQEAERFAAETDRQEARRSGILTILRNPGLAPEVRAGLGRLTRLDRIDNFRDNWWSLRYSPEDYRMRPDGGLVLTLYTPDSWAEPTTFLPASERLQAQREWHRLTTTAFHPALSIGKEALAWAEARPQDERVPELLHRLVRVSRYTTSPQGVSDSPIPRRAFTLLHRRYGATEWARRTPYWF